MKPNFTNWKVDFHPNFTDDQKEWICYKIGEWYLQNKDIMCDYDGRVHRLGHAKEVLKNMLCDEEKDEE